MPDDKDDFIIDINRIAKDVDALQKAFDALNKSGIDEEVMLAYLYYKIVFETIFMSIYISLLKIYRVGHSLKSPLK